MSQPDLFRPPRKPWNRNRMIGSKGPLEPKHFWARLAGMTAVTESHQRGSVQWVDGLSQ